MRLSKGMDEVCIFVDDTCDSRVIEKLRDNEVKLIALRCAGFNNVDLHAAAACHIPVVRVLAYSPHAVAEYAVRPHARALRLFHRPFHIRKRKMEPRKVSSAAMAIHTPRKPRLCDSHQAKVRRTHHMEKRLMAAGFKVSPAATQTE